MILFEKIEKKYNIDVQSYMVAISNYYLNCNTIDNPKYSIEKSKESFEILCRKLEEIFYICVNEVKIKENFEIYSSSLKDIIPKTGFSADTTKIEIITGLFRDFYITTELKFVNNITSVSDEFWQSLVKLSEIGQFEFNETNKPSRTMRNKYPQLFKNRSKFFKLFRNLIVNHLEYGFCQSLGFISVKWPNNISVENLICNYCESFKLMYNINYLLWSEEQKNQ